MTQTLELTGVKEIARGTIEVTFKKPADFYFTAGQNINLKLPELRFPDQKGPRRTFTIASAPHEPDVLLATRLSGSGYKRTLAELAAGTRCEFIGPTGQFVYDAHMPFAVYIAGGIGITPFRSMLMHSIHSGFETPTYLFYGNAAPESSAWHSLFLDLAENEKNFTYVPTMTDLAPDDPWQGERRWLSAEMIAEYLPEYKKSVFFLCGPPAMIPALTEQLLEHGTDGKNIRSESLWGY